MTPAPKRRWTFTLRTLFVVVTVFGIWLGYEMNWIRERHAFLTRRAEFRDFLVKKLATFDSEEVVIGNRIAVGQSTTNANWQLWVFRAYFPHFSREI